MSNEPTDQTLFCSLPFENLVIYDSQSFRPCYRMPQLRLKENTEIQGLFESAEMKSIRQSFLNSQWPDSCQNCRSQEEQGQISTRQRLGLQKSPEFFQKAKLKNLDLNFSNQCQSACRLCSSFVSSGWYELDKELSQFKGNPFARGQFRPKDESPPVDLQSLQDLQRLEFSSSEVFEQKKTLQFLQDLSKKDFAKQIHLKIMSTLIQLPPMDWMANLSQFKKVDIFVSVDGIESANEYLRHPLQWKQFLQNYNKLYEFTENHKSIVLHLHMALTAYNIFEVDEVKEWWTSMGQTNFSLVSLSQPNYLAPQALPTEVLDQAIKNTKSLDLNSALGPHKGKFSKELYELFLQFTKFLDSKQQTHLKQGLPKLYSLIGNDYERI